jgi:hypothetical protein
VRFPRPVVSKSDATCEVSQTGCGQTQDSLSLSMTDGNAEWHAARR